MGSTELTHATSPALAATAVGTAGLAGAISLAHGLAGTEITNLAEAALATLPATSIRPTLLVGAVGNAVGYAQAIKVAELAGAASAALASTAVRPALLADAVWQAALHTLPRTVAAHAAAATAAAATAAIIAALLATAVGLATRTGATTVALNLVHAQGIPG